MTQHFIECSLTRRAPTETFTLHYACKSPYSYLIDMGNGQVWHIHAKKIRKFIAPVHGCGAISDSDVDFVRVLQPVNNVCDSKPSERVSADRLTHLSDEQRDDLLSEIGRAHV